jgi:Family of unknown function (DUF6062)
MMTSTALTRWLKQGLAQGICPLCRASHKLDREYIWYFLEKWSMHQDHVDAFAHARGFCPDHTEQLRRAEVDGLGSTLGISDLYLASEPHTVERWARLLVRARYELRSGVGGAAVCRWPG